MRIGLAGPTSLTTLMRLRRSAAACAPRRKGSRATPAWQASFGAAAPDGIVRALEAARESLADIAPHLFSFGGIGATARWAAAVAAGRITLDGDGGFKVEGP